MNKNYVAADISCAILAARACHPQRVSTFLNPYLFKCWRFYLLCVIGALLLSTPDAPAATITVTNGNDHGPGSCGKRSSRWQGADKGEESWIGSSSRYWSTYPSTNAMPVVLVFPRTITV
jgi:hypothetical protein